MTTPVGVACVCACDRDRDIAGDCASHTRVSTACQHLLSQWLILVTYTSNVPETREHEPIRQLGVADFADLDFVASVLLSVGTRYSHPISQRSRRSGYK